MQREDRERKSQNQDQSEYARAGGQGVHSGWSSSTSPHLRQWVEERVRERSGLGHEPLLRALSRPRSGGEGITLS